MILNDTLALAINTPTLPPTQKNPQTNKQPKQNWYNAVPNLPDSPFIVGYPSGRGKSETCLLFNLCFVLNKLCSALGQIASHW